MPAPLGTGGQSSVQPAAQRSRRRGPCLPGHHFAVRNDQQGGNGLNIEATGQLRGLVHVHLHKLDGAGTFLCQFLQDRADHAAWATPDRPEVHQCRDRGSLRHGGEVGITGVRDPRQVSVAFAAPRTPGRNSRNSVGRTAFLALEQRGTHGRSPPLRWPAVMTPSHTRGRPRRRVQSPRRRVRSPRAPTHKTGRTLPGSGR